MLVWQDMPSMYWEDPFSAGPSYRSPVEKQQHQHALTPHDRGMHKTLVCHSAGKIPNSPDLFFHPRDQAAACPAHLLPYSDLKTSLLTTVCLI